MFNMRVNNLLIIALCCTQRSIDCIPFLFFLIFFFFFFLEAITSNLRNNKNNDTLDTLLSRISVFNNKREKMRQRLPIESLFSTMMIENLSEFCGKAKNFQECMINLILVNRKDQLAIRKKYQFHLCTTTHFRLNLTSQISSAITLIHLEKKSVLIIRSRSLPVVTFL